MCCESQLVIRDHTCSQFSRETQPTAHKSLERYSRDIFSGLAFLTSGLKYLSSTADFEQTIRYQKFCDKKLYNQ